MTIYQVSYDGDGDGHKGYSYHRTKREAKAAALGWEQQEGTGGTISDHVGTIATLEIPATVDGVLRALNVYASHCDNG